MIIFLHIIYLKNIMFLYNTQVFLLNYIKLLLSFMRLCDKFLFFDSITDTFIIIFTIITSLFSS